MKFVLIILENLGNVEDFILTMKRTRKRESRNLYNLLELQKYFYYAILILKKKDFLQKTFVHRTTISTCSIDIAKL